MDPVTLIVSALTAGATAALQETAGTAIKDAYQGLAGLVKKKFGNDEKAKKALVGTKKGYRTNQKTLKKSIESKGLSGDKEILKQAQKLYKLLENSGSIQNTIFNVKGDIKGFVKENTGNVVMNFNAPVRKRNKKKPG
jgi:pectate lyase